MTRPALSFVVIAALVVVHASACGGCADAATSGSLAAAATPTPTATAAPPATPPAPFADARASKDLAPSHPSMATLGSHVMQQLEREKRGRVPVPLSSERVAETFTKEGIELQPLKQGLGDPIGASYCAMSLTKDGVAFTVCEFKSEADALLGKKRSEARYGPDNLGRTLIVNGRSLLVLRPAMPSEATKQQAATLAAVFTALK